MLMNYKFEIVCSKYSSYTPVLSESIENAVWDYLKANDIEIEKRNDSLDNRLWLKDSIENQNLVIGHLNSENLKYSSLFSNSGVSNITHFVNLIGIDDIQGIYISDGYIPNYPIKTFEGWIKLDNIDRLNWFYKINRDHLADLQHNFKITDYKLEPYRDKLTEVLELFLTGGIREGNYYGRSAYEKFLLDLNSIRNHGTEHYKDLFYRMAFYITTGGIVTLKRLIKSLLNKLSLYKYASDIERIIRKFELLKLLLLKCSVNFQDDYILDVYDKFSAVFEQEVNLYCNILEQVNEMQDVKI